MTIDDYLSELERELRLRRAPRARLLAEVEGHLRDLSAELAADEHSPADAESQAVARFGDAATVAARFAQATASTTAQRAVNAASAALVGYAAVLVIFATASPVLRDFPQGAASFFAFQLATVSLGVALVRSLRWRGQVAAPTTALVAIARAVAVATIALVVAGVAEAAVALSRPAGVIPWSEGRWLTLAFAAAGVGVVAATLAALRASAQAAAVATLPSQDMNRATLLDDFDALAEKARLPQVARRGAAALLVHPWSATLLVAAAAFGTMTAVGAAGDHGSLAGSSVLGGIEAAVIVAAFAAFGHLLGLRSARA
jgi:hypothetical protein